VCCCGAAVVLCLKGDSVVLFHALGAGCVLLCGVCLEDGGQRGVWESELFKPAGVWLDQSSGLDRCDSPPTTSTPADS
jgi:hypothetical protein